MHLPSVGVRKLPQLEVYDDEAAEAAMEEQQIDAVPLVIDTQSSLATDEGEVPAEFHEECFQVGNERGLQIDFPSTRS